MVARDGIEPPTPAFSGLRTFPQGLRPRVRLERNGSRRSLTLERSPFEVWVGRKWWPGTESNRRRQPFQGCALPTELPGHSELIAHARASGGSCEDCERGERELIITIAARFAQTQGWTRAYPRGLKWRSMTTFLPVILRARTIRPRPGRRRCTWSQRRSGFCGAPFRWPWSRPCANPSCRKGGLSRSSRH